QVTAGTPTANTARHAFDLTPGRTVRLVTSVHGNGTYSNTTALQTVTDRAVERAATVDRAGIERAHRNHLDRWRTFWLKSYLDTGDKTLNKFYYGGLYAVAAANRAGFLPGGTYSPWRTTESANLGNRYFLNYNTESQYYGVYSANRPELAQPYYRVIEAEVPWQRNRTRAPVTRGSPSSAPSHRSTPPGPPPPRTRSPRSRTTRSCRATSRPTPPSRCCPSSWTTSTRVTSSSSVRRRTRS
ncbi:hypothetical protein, partial [Streptomyces sp. NPDC000851]